MDINIKSSSNWNRISGCTLADVIQTKVEQADGFVRSELDELLNKAILLGKPTTNATAEQCEIRISLFPRYKIDALTLVCSAAKAELFLGAQKEYFETVYGSLMEDEKDIEVPDAEQELLFYRYDVQLLKSGITELVIKFVNSCNELFVTGLQLQIAPNPNGITTLLTSAIDLNNVQQMLQSSNKKLSPSAEKCKSFMEMWQKQMAVGQNSNANATALLLEQLKLSDNAVPRVNVNANANAEAGHSCNMQQYIDQKLLEFEQRLNKRLTEQHAQQMQMLEQILDKLNK